MKSLPPINLVFLAQALAAFLCFGLAGAATFDLFPIMDSEVTPGTSWESGDECH
jgi:hypothetical protein